MIGYITLKVKIEINYNDQVLSVWETEQITPEDSDEGYVIVGTRFNHHQINIESLKEIDPDTLEISASVYVKEIKGIDGAIMDVEKWNKYGVI